MRFDCRHACLQLDLANNELQTHTVRVAAAFTLFMSANNMVQAHALLLKARVPAISLANNELQAHTIRVAAAFTLFM